LCQLAGANLDLAVGPADGLLVLYVWHGAQDAIVASTRRCCWRPRA